MVELRGDQAVDGAKYMAEDLKQFTSDCFVASGVPHEDAVWTADALVCADLSGKSTHGISRLLAYIGGIDKGKINPRPNVVIQTTGLVTATIDGDNGLGQVVARDAMQVAIKQAQNSGLGAVTVRRGNHVGTLNRYTKMAADEGLIGFMFTNAQPAIPPWGGRRAYFGTNPIAMAAGTEDRQISLDLATSITARGNIIMAAKNGTEIPEGWAIDAEGAPTTDPIKALSGAVLPMAGPKGYSLALMVEILSGVLSGAAIGDQVGSVYDDSPNSSNLGMFILVLNPTAFLEHPGEFESRLERMEQAIHKNPLAKGVESIYLPGERYRESLRREGYNEVNVSRAIQDELQNLAKRFSLKMPKKLVI